jgi:hypothetical protein
MQLGEQRAVELYHGLLGKAAAESGKGGVIRSGLIQWQSQEGFEGDAVVDLAFELGIGGDLKPFLKQQAFEQQKGRVGLAALGLFASLVELIQEVFDRIPVDGQIELFENGQGAVFIGMLFDGKVGEGKEALGLRYAMMPPDRL